VPDIIDKKTNKRWVNWGEDNKLPNYLWDCYLKCSNLQAIVNSFCNYISGDGIEIKKYFNSIYAAETLEEVIQKCIMDYVIFGGFAVECIRSTIGDVVRVNYIDVQNVRLNEDLTTAFLSNKWGSYSGKNMIELPLFDSDKKQNHFILYYRGSITRNINPIPIWISSLKSVEVLNQTRNFNLNNIVNNFSGGAVIAFNGTQLKSKEMKEIKEKLEDNYTGSTNAGKMLVINNPNGEGKVEVTRLQPDNMGDLYKNLQDSSEHDLFVSFRINPMLLGLNESTGFAAQEFENAFVLFNTTVIKPIQNNFSKTFKKIGIEISFKDFKINWKEE
jgi:capsid portal protein